MANLLSGPSSGGGSSSPMGQRSGMLSMLSASGSNGKSELQATSGYSRKHSSSVRSLA